MTCKYRKSFDHVIEECPILMAKMQEKMNQQPTQNIHMMTVERRIEEPKINIGNRSGVATGSDKEDEKKESENAWVIKIVEKAPIFYIHK